MKSTSPAQLLLQLKEGARLQKQRNLDVVHEICAELHRLGSRDFSLATIGRMSGERGGISKNALYNKTSVDFQALIEAWRVFSNTATHKSIPRTEVRPDSDETLLRKIPDVAVRSIMGMIIAERNRLRTEVKILKGSTSIVIDKRVVPGQIQKEADGQLVQVLEASGLSETERKALAKAISPAFLTQENWRLGENGEVYNERGRPLFDLGFANAIRKILNG